MPHFHITAHQEVFTAMGYGPPRHLQCGLRHSTAFFPDCRQANVNTLAGMVQFLTFGTVFL